MIRKLLETIIGQIITVILCSTLLTFILVCFFIFAPKGPPGPPWPWKTTYKLVSVFNIVRTEKIENYDKLVARLNSDNESIRISKFADSCKYNNLNSWDLKRTLSYEIGKKNIESVTSCNQSDQTKHIRAILTLLDNNYLIIDVYDIGRNPRRFTFPTVCAIVFLLSGIAILSIWALYRVIFPLRKLAKHTDDFRNKINFISLKEEGPLEIKKVINSINLMQKNIEKHIKSRDTMLMAISHDLKTPLTKMLLSIENIPASIHKQRIIKNITLMDSLITTSLIYLKTGSDGEEYDWIDIDSYVDAICDDYYDRDVTIEYISEASIPVYCKPYSLQRAIINIIENSCYYASEIYIAFRSTDHYNILEISDNGPGISLEIIDKVKSPFFTAKIAKKEINTNYGLGLSIVDEIITDHGGKISIENLETGGLNVTIYLPKTGLINHQ